MLILVTCCFFVSISVLICLDRQQGSSLLIVTVFHGVPLPLHTALNFCSFAASHTLHLSMGCTANPKCVLKKQSAHSELQKAAIFFPPFTERCFRELPHCFAKKYKSMNGNIFFYSDQASSAGPPDPSFLVGLVGIGNEIMMRKDKSCNYFIFFFIVLSEHVLHNGQGFM